AGVPRGGRRPRGIRLLRGGARRAPPRRRWTARLARTARNAERARDARRPRALDVGLAPWAIRELSAPVPLRRPARTRPKPHDADGARRRLPRRPRNVPRPDRPATADARAPSSA